MPKMALDSNQTSLRRVEEIFPAVKRPKRKFEHSHPSNSDVKNEWSHTFTPLYVSVSWVGITLFGSNSVLKLLDRLV
jgi:hypothetical protein